MSKQRRTKGAHSDVTPRPSPDEMTEAIDRAIDDLGDQHDDFVAAAARQVLEKTER